MNSNYIINKAKNFAYKKHENQKRKGKESAFTNHLDLAYLIGSQLTTNETVLSTIWLHDVLEDTPTNPEDILNEFGEEILKLVKLETEDKSLEWYERKIKQIEELACTKNPEVLYIAFSDKLSNLLEIEQDYRIIGEQIWDRFKRGKKEQYWYYNEFLKIFELNKEYLFNDKNIHLLNIYKKIINNILL